MNFEEVYNNYLEYASKRHKKQGFDTITNNFNLHIIPYFKNMDIQKITKKDILDWQTFILTKEYSNNFNRNLYYELSAFFRFCFTYSYISENIVLQVERFPKRIENKKHNVYTLSEFRKFRKHLDNKIIKQYFNFMYFCGTRPSEAMALHFSDLENNLVHINHSIQRKGKRELDTPKNQSSIRTIKISLLMQFRIWNLKKYYEKKFGYGNDYFIFGGNKPLAPTTIDRHKLNACIKAKMKPITQHEFRHSYATRMINKKKPINVVSKSMGHSNVSMTLDVYVH